MPKGKTPKPTSAALVLTDSELTFRKSDLPKLQLTALRELETIRNLRRETAARAVMVGLMLHRIKASLKHGEWLPWIKGNVKGIGYQQCNFYMRAATVFVDTMRVSKPDLLALPGDQTQLSLDTTEGEARAFFSKLSKFVGELSFSDLLDKYGIKETKKVGGAREKTSDDAPVETDPEQLYLAARDEIGGALARAEALLVTENRLQFLAGHPEEISGVVSGLRALADKVEAAAKPLLKV